eukprot:TRINITY_DN74728_c0_g1_i1.p1 TRINITY_DN74728_c0_g1~~TRINITY_DN74728_c0_g1_i1.p1  ORF type:complete len:461 (-),score=41.83 TRINITY_DN74728_c0_g1_i1:22-1404(-)
MVLLSLLAWAVVSIVVFQAACVRGSRTRFVAPPLPSNASAIPPEFASDIPSSAILVSEELVRHCGPNIDGTPGASYASPTSLTSASSNSHGCYAHALAQIACAALHAEGVELWVIVAAPRSVEDLVDVLHEEVDAPLHTCFSTMAEKGLIQFLVDKETSRNVWARDFAPALTVTPDGAPSRLLRVPHKRFQSFDELDFRIASNVERLSGIRPDVEALLENDGNTSARCSFDWGNFETDGAGMCLLADVEQVSGRCPHLKTFLSEHAGCEIFPTDFVPLPEQTHHVDIFARFVKQRTLLMTRYQKGSRGRTFGTCKRDLLTLAKNVLKTNRKDFFELNDDDVEDLSIVDLPTPLACFTKADVYASRDGREALVGFANVLVIQGTRRRALLFPTYHDIAETSGSMFWPTVQAISEKEHDIARRTWRHHLSLAEEDVFDVEASEMMTKGGGPHCITKQYQFSK